MSCGEQLISSSSSPVYDVVNPLSARPSYYVASIRNTKNQRFDLITVTHWACAYSDWANSDYKHDGSCFIFNNNILT